MSGHRWTAARLLLLPPALSVLAACEAAPPSSPHAGEDPDAVAQTSVEDDVGEFLDGYLAGIESRDTAALRTMYAGPDRLIWIEDGTVRYRSADAILEGFASFPEESVIRTVLQDLAVSPVANNGAVASADFTTSVGDGPGSYQFGGAIMFVLERDVTGWRIVAGHTSSTVVTPR